MSRQIGGIDVKFRDLNSNFHRWWVDYSPSVRMLPKGWKRGEGYRPLPKDLIWEKDVDIPLRDGIKLRADVFRPRETEDRPLPALLPWSPYGKTGIGRCLCTVSSKLRIHSIGT
jgi:predicted acyl esterase